MLFSILPVPFADAARQRQYDAVLAALQAEAAAPATVLLGNLAAWTTLAADALLVRPAGWALLVLTPHAGHLTIPALATGGWRLDGQPLPGQAGADNPFAQCQQQLPAAAGWLSEQLGLPAAELPPCLGIALFDAPLTFGPEVEAQLHHHVATCEFQLVGGTTQLAARLRQQLDFEDNSLAEEELLEWGEYLANEPYLTPKQDLAESPAHYLAQKLQQLWRWLGAADIPADPPYGSASPPDTRLRDQQEQARLQQLRQELQAELAQQRQEAAQREATRTQELAQLRQQLTHTTSSAAERLAEQQEKARLEAALQTTRAELAARNHELDARIQQLGQLIKQLQQPAASPAETRPLAASPKLPPAPGRPLASVPPRKRSYRRLRQAERWGLVGLAAAIIVAGGWGLVRTMHATKNQPASAATRRAIPTTSEEESAGPAPVFVYDTLASPGAASPDTAGTPSAAPPATETPESPKLSVPAAPLRVDSAAPISQPSHPAAPADSAAPSPSPTP